MADRMTWARRTALPALALMLAAAAARAGDAPDLDRALKQQAPAVVKYLQSRGDRTAAVLKFLVDPGDGKLRDNVGDLNRTLADRMEVALVLALDPADEQSLGILTHASDVVAKSHDKTLNHRTENGRAAFFPTDVPPLAIPRAWVRPMQDDKAAADAFVTGEVVVARDWKSLRVRLQVFDRKDPKDLHAVGDEFAAAIDPRTLSEMGVSFAHKKGVPDGPDDSASEQEDKVAFQPPTLPNSPPPTPDEAEKRQKAWEQFLRDCPVEFQILYNGKPVTVRDGAVDTPDEDDVVTFRLKNNDPKMTYGVVLKINGESTIEHQTLPALDCYKWVLAPGEEITVDGFQGDNEVATGFKVLAPAASRARAVNYGDNAGLFSLAVFRAAASDDDRALVTNDDKRNQDVKAVSRGSLVTPGGKQPEQSLKALQDALTVGDGLSNAAKRGIIVPDKEHPSKIKHVDFIPVPRMDYAVELRYYQPKE